MSAERNKTVVRRFYEEVVNGGDVAALKELATADYDEHDPLPGQTAGRGGLEDRLTLLGNALGLRVTLEDVIAEGDKVVVRWISNGEHVGEFLGMPPTGKTFTVAGIDIFRLGTAVRRRRRRRTQLGGP